MPNKPEEKIRIYFSSGDFDKTEVAEITDAFNKIAPTRGCSNAHISMDSVDATAIVETAFLAIIIFAGIEIGKGFFSSIGEDLKEKLATVLGHKKKPSVHFDIFYKHARITINAKGENVEEWKKIFETINKAGELAINEIEKDSRIHGVIVNYDVSVDGYWKIDSLP